MITAIHGGWVVAFHNGSHELLHGGTVVYSGDRILFVGWPDDPECPRADRVIDATGRLISPGLINLHCIANIDLQPLRIDVASPGFFKSREWIMDGIDGPIWTEEEFAVSAEYAVASLLKAGSTTFCTVVTGASKRFEDPECEPLALAEASERLGARGYISHNYREATGYSLPDGGTQIVWNRRAAEEGMARAISLVKRLKERGNDRIRGFLFPYTTEHCSAEILTESKRQAVALGTVVRSHFAQYRQEYFHVKERTGKTPVEWLESIGFLGPETTLTHAIFISGHPSLGTEPDCDLEILRETETSVAHCPVVFARSGVSLRSFDRYIQSGINVGLGTDTFPPDLVDEMRIGALVAKVVTGEKLAGTCRDLFNAGTLGGAAALRRDDIGRLSPGAKADISIFNLSTLGPGPIDDPIKALIHQYGGFSAETVIVDGRTVVEGGVVVGVDEERLAARGQEVWEKYVRGLAAWDPRGRSARELWPPAFPIRERMTR